MSRYPSFNSPPLIHHKNCERKLQNVFSMPPLLCIPMYANLTEPQHFLSLDLLQLPTNWFFCLQLFSSVMYSLCLCKCKLDYVTFLLYIPQWVSNALMENTQNICCGLISRAKLLPYFHVLPPESHSSVISSLSPCSTICSSFFSLQFSSVQFSRSVVSDSLRPHELQHSRPPCPSPTPGVHSNSHPSSR